MTRRVMLLVSLALSLALTLAACDRGVRVDDEDYGTTVKVASGETLIVRLGSNRTTGYGWRVRDLPDCLAQDGEPEYESKGAPGMMGAPGEETWRFTAGDAGEGALVLEYVRSWEEEQPPANLYEINVVVE